MDSPRPTGDICTCLRCGSFIERPTSSERRWYVTVIPALGLCADCCYTISMAAINNYAGLRLEQLLAGSGSGVAA